MRSTTVRELRNNYSKVLEWVAAGDEVEVTRRGKIVAKVVPVSPSLRRKVDWSKSAALNRQPWAKTLTLEQKNGLLADSRGTEESGS